VIILATWYLFFRFIVCLKIICLNFFFSVATELSSTHYRLPFSPSLGRRLAYLITRKYDIATKVSRISNTTLPKNNIMN
jgi:hypothetical protein